MARTPAEQRWSALIDRQEASGQTTRAFAEANDLNARTLAWWRSQLKRVRTKTKPVAFVELKVADDPTRVLDPKDRTVVVALDDIAAHVVVDWDTDLELLKRVLSALC